MDKITPTKLIRNILHSNLFRNGAGDTAGDDTVEAQYSIKFPTANMVLEDINSGAIIASGAEEVGKVVYSHGLAILGMLDGLTGRSIIDDQSVGICNSRVAHYNSAVKAVVTTLQGPGTNSPTIIISDDTTDLKTASREHRTLALATGIYYVAIGFAFIYGGQEVYNLMVKGGESAMAVASKISKITTVKNNVGYLGLVSLYSRIINYVTSCTGNVFNDKLSAVIAGVGDIFEKMLVLKDADGNLVLDKVDTQYTADDERLEFILSICNNVAMRNAYKYLLVSNTPGRIGLYSNKKNLPIASAVAAQVVDGVDWRDIIYTGDNESIPTFNLTSLDYNIRDLVTLRAALATREPEGSVTEEGMKSFFKILFAKEYLEKLITDAINTLYASNGNKVFKFFNIPIGRVYAFGETGYGKYSSYKETYRSVVEYVESMAAGLIEAYYTDNKFPQAPRPSDNVVGVLIANSGVKPCEIAELVSDRAPSRIVASYFDNSLPMVASIGSNLMTKQNLLGSIGGTYKIDNALLACLSKFDAISIDDEVRPPYDVVRSNSFSTDVIQDRHLELAYKLYGKMGPGTLLAWVL